MCKSRDVSNKTFFGEIAEFQNDQALNHPLIEFSPEHPGAFEKKSWISLKYPKEITKIPHLSHFMRNKIRHMTSRFTQINTACKETTRCFRTPILGLAPSPPRMRPRMTEDSGKNRHSTKGVHHLVTKVFWNNNKPLQNWRCLLLRIFCSTLETWWYELGKLAFSWRDVKLI